MTSHRATSYLDEFGSPDRVFLERRSAWSKMVSVLAVMLGSGFLLFGLLFLWVMVFPSGEGPPLEPAARVVGYCLSAIFLGLAGLLFYAPLRRWRTGVTGCACYADRFVIFSLRRWRCVPYRDLLRVENRRAGMTVTTADGRTLRIAGAVEDRETLYTWLQQAIPAPVETVPESVETVQKRVETAQTSARSTDLPLSVQAGSRAISSSHERAPTSQFAVSDRSGPPKPFTYHDPLRRFHLALVGGVLIAAAFLLNNYFAELASGERESVRVWAGFALLYNTLGPTLTVWVTGLGGVVLTAVGIMRGLAAPSDENPADQYDPLSSRTW